MSTVPMVIDQSKATEIETRAQAMAREVRDLEVIDAASHSLAAEFAQLGAAMEAEIHAFMDPICTSAFEHHRMLTAKRGELLKVPTEIKRVAAEKAVAFERAERRRREEAEAQAQRERERLQREELERVAAENRRLEAEAAAARAAAAEAARAEAAAEAERILADAQAAAARGDAKAEAAAVEQAQKVQDQGIAAAQAVSARPLEVATVAPRPVFVPPPDLPPAPKVEGLTSRTDWDFELVDIALIPRQYLVPDEKSIRAVVRALKDKHGIPGIKAVEKIIPQTRRR